MKSLNVTSTLPDGAVVKCRGLALQEAGSCSSLRCLSSPVRAVAVHLVGFMR